MDGKSNGPTVQQKDRQTNRRKDGKTQICKQTERQAERWKAIGQRGNQINFSTGGSSRSLKVEAKEARQF
jgi:hypothetical protein